MGSDYTYFAVSNRPLYTVRGREEKKGRIHFVDNHGPKDNCWGCMQSKYKSKALQTINL